MTWLNTTHSSVFAMKEGRKPVYSCLNELLFTFSRCFYPKRLKVHSGYTYFGQYMCSLGIEPTAFVLLTQCSTTEPQELRVGLRVGFLRSGVIRACLNAEGKLPV